MFCPHEVYFVHVGYKKRSGGYLLVFSALTVSFEEERANERQNQEFSVKPHSVFQ